MIASPYQTWSDEELLDEADERDKLPKSAVNFLDGLMQWYDRTGSLTNGQRGTLVKILQEDDG